MAISAWVTGSDLNANTPIKPETYGAVGNANYRDETTGVLYADAALTVPATDDATAIEAAIAQAVAEKRALKLTGQYYSSRKIDFRYVTHLQSENAWIRFADPGTSSGACIWAGATEAGKYIELDWRGRLHIELPDMRDVRGYYESTGTRAFRVEYAKGTLEGIVSYGGLYTEALYCEDLVFERPESYRSTHNALAALLSRRVTFNKPVVREAATALSTERAEDTTFTDVDVERIWSGLWRFEDSHRSRILGGRLSDGNGGNFYLPKSASATTYGEDIILQSGDTLSYEKQDHVVEGVVLVNAHRPPTPLPFSSAYSLGACGNVVTCSGGGRGTMRNVKIINTDPEPSLLTDLAAGVVTNPDLKAGIVVEVREPGEVLFYETIEEPHRGGSARTLRLTATTEGAKLPAGPYSIGYINLASPVDLRPTRLITVDLYRSYRAYTGHLLCRIYSGANRTGLLGEHTFGSSGYYQQTMQVAIPYGHVPEADLASVACIEFVYQGAASASGTSEELDTVTISHITDRPTPYAAFANGKIDHGEALILEECQEIGYRRRIYSHYRKGAGYPVVIERSDVARE